MSTFAPPLLYALFVWWFSTGLVLYVVRLPRATRGWTLLAASAVLIAALGALKVSAADASVAGAYTAFTGAVLVWGWVEFTFLTGLITGPRVTPCPDDSAGWRRVGHAIGTILHHELALFAAGTAVAAVTWGGANRIGFWTFAILWTMRLSAKLNLFLGVPVTNAEFLPDRLRYLASYFRRGQVNRLFPVAVAGSTAATVLLALRALSPDASPFDAAGYALLAVLMALAVLEHWFMVFKLPLAAMWSWGLRTERQAAPPAAATRAALRIPPRAS